MNKSKKVKTYGSMLMYFRKGERKAIEDKLGRKVNSRDFIEPMQRNLDLLDIICPVCKFSGMDMVGDPEYNDEWHCNNCDHTGGSSYGVPKGHNE